MKISNIHTSTALLLLTSILFIACNKSDVDTTATITCDGTRTYTANTKAIIDKNCTSSGCHNAGSSRGDFTSYAGLKPFLTGGSFYKEVITNKTMPKGSRLSTDDYNALYCWAKNNYAE